MEWTGLPFNEARRYVDGDLKESCAPGFAVTARSLLQTFGTDWARNQVADDIWVRIAARRISYFLAHGYQVVIDDVRFPNEVELIRSMGGVILSVVRPGVSATSADHEAERSLEGVEPDGVIPNDGDLGDLYAGTLITLSEVGRRCLTATH